MVSISSPLRSYLSDTLSTGMPNGRSLALLVSWESEAWFKRLEGPHPQNQLVARMTELVETAAGALGAPVLAKYLPAMLHTRRCPEDIRAAINSWSKSAYQFVCSEFPALSKRTRAALVKQSAALLVLESLQSARTETGMPHPQQMLLVRECKRLEQSQRHSLAAVFSVGALGILGLGAAQRLWDVGILSDPLGYVSRSEGEMLLQTASKLRSVGHAEQANLVENLDVAALQEQILTSLGFLPREINLYSRKDSLNHLGLIRSPLSAINPHNGEQDLVLRAKYDRFFDTILVQPNLFDRQDIVHELTHRLGYFAETGWQEQLQYNGPCLEIEEGICNLVAHGPGSIDTYQNIFSAGLLAIALGKEGPMRSEDDLTNAYKRGLRTLAQAFVVEHSVQCIRDRYRVVTGAADAYHRDIESPYHNGLTGEAIPVTVIARLESLGVKADLVLGWFEKEMAVQRGARSFPCLDRINLIIASNLTPPDSQLRTFERESAQVKSFRSRALRLIALRPGSALSSAYIYALAEDLWNSREPQSQAQAVQLLGLVVNDSDSIIRDRAAVLLSLYGVQSGRYAVREAQQLLSSVSRTTNLASLPYYSTLKREMSAAQNHNSDRPASRVVGLD